MLSQQPSVTGTSYTPSTMQHSFQQSTISTPGTPFIEQNMSRSGGTPSTGLFDVHNHSGTAQDAQRPPISSAQSFVDKAKGGYQSPYDLPMEVVKPRRRPQATPRESSSQFPTPPPRSSSFHQPTAPPSSNSAPPPMPSATNTPDGLARSFGFIGRSAKNPLSVLGVVVEDTGGVAVAATGGNVGVLVALGIGGGALLLLGGAVGWWKLLLLGGGVGN